MIDVDALKLSPAIASGFSWRVEDPPKVPWLPFWCPEIGFRPGPHGLREYDHAVFEPHRQAFKELCDLPLDFFDTHCQELVFRKFKASLLDLTPEEAEIWGDLVLVDAPSGVLAKLSAIESIDVGRDRKIVIRFEPKYDAECTLDLYLKDGKVT